MLGGFELHVPDHVPDNLRLHWRCLLRDQHGMVTVEQAQRHGVSPDAIVAHVRARRWRRHLHGVYATFTGPPPRAACIVAAMLYAGDPVLVSHRTAAEEWGMVPVDDLEPVHVTVPYGCAAVSKPGLVIVHRSRAFRHIVAAGTQPPRTSRIDTAIDMASLEPTRQDARRRFVALITALKVPVWEIAAHLEIRPPHRHRKALAEGLRLVASGVQSALEERYAIDVEAAHGLPPARRQQPVLVDGRTLYEDATYDHLGAALTVRLDGRLYHSSPAITFRDRRRDNAAELAGRARLVYGWRDVTGNPCAVAQEVITVLRRYGWGGEHRPCGRCS